MEKMTTAQAALTMVDKTTRKASRRGRCSPGEPRGDRGRRTNSGDNRMRPGRARGVIAVIIHFLYVDDRGPKRDILNE
jgi:hypothetical protein